MSTRSAASTAAEPSCTVSSPLVTWHWLNAIGAAWPSAVGLSVAEDAHAVADLLHLGGCVAAGRRRVREVVGRERAARRLEDLDEERVGPVGDVGAGRGAGAEDVGEHLVAVGLVGALLLGDLVGLRLELTAGERRRVVGRREATGQRVRQGQLEWSRPRRPRCRWPSAARSRTPPADRGSRCRARCRPTTTSGWMWECSRPRDATRPPDAVRRRVRGYSRGVTSSATPDEPTAATLGALVVRTVRLDLAAAASLLDLLPADRPVTWLRRGDGLVGWGVAAEVRTHGDTRFSDAGKWWSEITARAVVRDEVNEPGTGLVSFGSFAFADEPGRLRPGRPRDRPRPARRHRLADDGGRRRHRHRPRSHPHRRRPTHRPA